MDLGAEINLKLFILIRKGNFDRKYIEELYPVI